MVDMQMPGITFAKVRLICLGYKGHPTRISGMVIKIISTYIFLPGIKEFSAR